MATLQQDHGEKAKTIHVSEDGIVDASGGGYAWERRGRTTRRQFESRGRESRDHTSGLFCGQEMRSDLVEVAIKGDANLVKKVLFTRG